MTPDQLREGIANLNGILASGARTTVLGGQSVTYNTAASIIAARNDLQAQLNILDPQPDAPRRSRHIYTVYAGRDFQTGGH